MKIDYIDIEKEIFREYEELKNRMDEAQKIFEENPTIANEDELNTIKDEMKKFLKDNQGHKDLPSPDSMT